MTVINISYTSFENTMFYLSFTTFIVIFLISLQKKENTNLQSCIPCKPPSFLQSCSRLDIKYSCEIVLNVTLASDITSPDITSTAPLPQSPRPKHFNMEP